MNQFDLPPMSPEELTILASLAGPLFAESRNIEKMTSDNTVIGGHLQDGSMKIKGALEQAQQLVRAQRPPEPQYIPPEYYQQASQISVPNTPTVVIPQQIECKPVDEAQLEFSFDMSNQSVTNDLLREISKKLTKLINLIEKSEKEDTIPKLKNQQTKHDHVKQTQV